MNTPPSSAPLSDATATFGNGSGCQRIPLLALHGFTGCGADFQWLATHTADCLRWHTFDFPGHGTNHAVQSPRAYTAAATARAVYAALQALPYSAKNGLPLLLGYSMGGRMALRTLAQYGTASIRGLILIGASTGLADATERRARRCSDHALAAKIEAEGIPAFTEHWNKVPIIASQRRSPYFATLQAMRAGNSAAGLAGSLRGIGTGALAPVHHRLPQITVPCLLLTGEEDTKFTAIAQAMQATLPDARHVIIPAAGHSPHWENPTATEDAIRAWVRARFSPSR